MENPPPLPIVPTPETPIDPIVTPSTPPTLTPPPTEPIEKSKLVISFLIAITLFSIGIAAFFGYQYLKLNQTNTVAQDSETSLEPVDDTTNNDSDNSSVIETSQPKVFFTKDPDKDNYQDIQAWIMDPDGSSLEQVGLPPFNFAYKHLQSNIIFYIPLDTDGTISTYNLTTREVTNHTLITHPEPQVIENIQISSLDQISPDNSAFVYNVFFTEPCPESDVVTEGMPGGGGPCEPEPNPDFNNGYYLFDLKSNSSTFLGDELRVSRWDINNNSMYYVDNFSTNAGLYKVDLESKNRSQVLNAGTFGYFAYPLFQKDFFVVSEGTTGDQAGQASMSNLKLLNKTTKAETIIDTGDWAEIQPFVSLSPDENLLLYERTSQLQNGHTYNSIYLYDFNTNQTRRLTPDSTELSYSPKGFWIDNNTFITIVYTIESENFYNGNNYLVSIDVPNGKITRLTPENDVYSFYSF